MSWRTQTVRSRIFSFILGATAVAALVGCSTPPVASVNNEALPFEQAIGVATDALMQQTQKMPGFLAKLDRRSLVLDPSIDAGSGQQTLATQRLDRAIAERLMRGSGQIEVLPFQAADLSKAQFLLTGTLMRSQNNYRLNLALVDVKAGTVTAQSSALARAEGVDMSPLPYYRDSPVLVKDQVVEGDVRTSSTPPGQKADRLYLDRIATATVINDATMLYDSARYKEALERYRSAAATPAGDQIRVLNGIYLSTLKLGQTAEAEQAFGRVVAYGISHDRLGVKFLFSPGSTDFWPDPKVSSAYAMWLRQIARQGAAAKVCMNIVGHTSKTGPEAVNDSLSLKRALYIKQRLNSESSEFANRARTEGMGSRMNIVGSGSDDVVDALDRRVEFAIVDCAR
jgi:outer membrane protein OmpA-like peptidoglycan-associated protein